MRICRRGNANNKARRRDNSIVRAQNRGTQPTDTLNEVCFTVKGMHSSYFPKSCGRLRISGQ